MAWLLLGIIALTLLWAVGRWGINTSPRNLRWTGLAILAFLCLVTAVFLAVRGQLGGAAAFATGAMALYGRYRWIKGIFDRIAGIGGAASRGNTGHGGANRGNGGRARNASVASEDEARAVLGLKPDADREAVLAAHKRLMRLVHPDRGGTDYLAAKINQARDILLERIDNH